MGIVVHTFVKVTSIVWVCLWYMLYSVFVSNTSDTRRNVYHVKIPGVAKLEPPLSPSEINGPMEDFHSYHQKQLETFMQDYDLLTFRAEILKGRVEAKKHEFMFKFMSIMRVSGKEN